MEISHCELERYHYEALKCREYQMEGMLDCFREEISMSMPYYYPKEETPQPIVFPRAIWFKNDIRALKLNHRVTELENSNRYLLKKIKELTAYASKRRPKDKI